jgi:hypothetical protein
MPHGFRPFTGLAAAGWQFFAFSGQVRNQFADIVDQINVF